jgi:hypothetical protein
MSEQKMKITVEGACVLFEHHVSVEVAGESFQVPSVAVERGRAEEFWKVQPDAAIEHRFPSPLRLTGAARVLVPLEVIERARAA